MSLTRPPYPFEFREQMVELVRSGRSPEELAREFKPPCHAIIVIPTAFVAIRTARRPTDSAESRYDP